MVFSVWLVRNEPLFFLRYYGPAFGQREHGKLPLKLVTKSRRKIFGLYLTETNLELVDYTSKTKKKR